MRAKLIGDKETRQLLQSLPGRIARKHLRRALSLGCNPIVRAVKARTPKRKKNGGSLKRSIGKRVTKARKNGAAAAIVGAKRSTKGKNGENPSRYLHHGENDVAPHDMSKRALRRKDGGGYVAGKGKGKHPGTKGRKFLAAAFAASKDLGRRIMAATLANGLRAEAGKRR
jgi:hypothetical protein